MDPFRNHKKHDIKSCQECIIEMLIFCEDCPHINTNIRSKIETRGKIDVEQWVHEQYASAKNCNDYRTLNKLQDELIYAIRAFETEVERWK